MIRTLASLAAAVLVSGALFLQTSPSQAASITLAPTGPSGGVTINLNGKNNSNQPFPNAGTPVCGSACAGPPNWSGGASYNFPQFNPALGTLTRVDLDLVVTHNYGGVIYTNNFGAWSGGVLNDAGINGNIAVNTITSPAIPGPVTIISKAEGAITGFSGNFGGTVFRQSATRSEAHPTQTYLDTIGIPSDFIGAGTFPVSVVHDPLAQPLFNGTGSSSSNSLPLKNVTISGVPGSFVVPWTFSRGFILLNSSVTYTYDPAPGDDQNDPILPDGGGPNAGGDFEFSGAPGGGKWFDPPLASGFLYQTDGNSNFTKVGLPLGVEPAGDMMYTIVDDVNGSITLAEGATHTFATPVDRFAITGIEPAVDGGDPLAFPTFLEFDQSTVTFKMTPIPEPTTLALVWCGLLVVFCGGRKRLAA